MCVYRCISLHTHTQCQMHIQYMNIICAHILILTRTLPLGTPPVILTQSDKEPLMDTLCFLSAKKSLIQSNNFPVIPYDWSLVSSRL